MLFEMLSCWSCWSCGFAELLNWRFAEFRICLIGELW